MDSMMPVFSTAKICMLKFQVEAFSAPISEIVSRMSRVIEDSLVSRDKNIIIKEIKRSQKEKKDLIDF